MRLRKSRSRASGRSAVVLLSGGMDSAALLYYVRRLLAVESVHAVSFLYGQKHAREIRMARRQAKDAGVSEHVLADISFVAELIPGVSALTDPDVAVPGLGEIAEADRDQPVTYVPHRNLIFLAVAAAYAEAHGIRDVFAGIQRQDRYGYWDCTADFTRRLNAVLGLNRRNAVVVQAPFVGLAKAEVLQIGLELGVDYGHTWTCYKGGGRPCGTCPSCAERASAFRSAGINDPLCGA